MNTLLLPLLLIAIVINSPAAVSNAADETRWTRVSPPGEPYVVEMPGEPRRRDEQDATIVGNVDRVTFTWEKDGRSYNANRIDLPRIATMFMSDEALYEQVREGLLKNDEAVETSYADVERNGYEGKRLEYTKKGAAGPREVRAEFYLVDGFMLNFLASVPKGAPKTGIDRFMSSIELSEE